MAFDPDVLFPEVFNRLQKLGLVVHWRKDNPSGISVAWDASAAEILEDLRGLVSMAWLNENDEAPVVFRLMARDLASRGPESRAVGFRPAAGDGALPPRLTREALRKVWKQCVDTGILEFADDTPESVRWSEEGFKMAITYHHLAEATGMGDDEDLLIVLVLVLLNYTPK